MWGEGGAQGQASKASGKSCCLAMREQLGSGSRSMALTWNQRVGLGTELPGWGAAPSAATAPPPLLLLLPNTASATSWIPDVAMVESTNGIPAAAAAWAMASSPSGWHSRCCAMGAISMGEDSRWPARVAGKGRGKGNWAGKQAGRIAVLQQRFCSQPVRCRYVSLPGVVASCIYPSCIPTSLPIIPSLTKQPRAGVHGRHIHQHARQQAVARQRLPVLPQRPLVVRAAGIVAVCLQGGGGQHGGSARW